jgi:hypothetical protein
MIESRFTNVKCVTGPDGSALTLANLPAPGIIRWVIRRKAEVVAAVRGGLLSLEEACARYALTVEEFLDWQKSIDSHGLNGLRSTHLQKYAGSRFTSRFQCECRRRTSPRRRRDRAAQLRRRGADRSYFGLLLFVDGMCLQRLLNLLNLRCWPRRDSLRRGATLLLPSSFVFCTRLHTDGPFCAMPRNSFRKGYIDGWSSIRGDEPAPPVPAYSAEPGKSPYRVGVVRGVKDACAKAHSKPMASGSGGTDAWLESALRRGKH